MIGWSACLSAVAVTRLSDFGPDFFSFCIFSALVRGVRAGVLRKFGCVMYVCSTVNAWCWHFAGLGSGLEGFRHVVMLNTTRTAHTHTT